MHSTSKVTWSDSTSATLRGNVIIGSGQTGASRPTNRYERFIHRERHAGHGLDPADRNLQLTGYQRHALSGWGEARLAMDATSRSPIRAAEHCRGGHPLGHRPGVAC